MRLERVNRLCVWKAYDIYTIYVTFTVALFLSSSLVWRKRKSFALELETEFPLVVVVLDSFFLHRRTSSENENSPDFMSRKRCVSPTRKWNFLPKAIPVQASNCVTLTVNYSNFNREKESKNLNRKFAMSLLYSRHIIKLRMWNFAIISRQSLSLFNAHSHEAFI